ncbi:hypothetical protein JW710_01055 [Candidatus Dojkabacteria bacterium]|nr:hypothetical protein [Candidatus Dojkabacteria bacterium]
MSRTISRKKSISGLGLNLVTHTNDPVRIKKYVDSVKKLNAWIRMEFDFYRYEKNPSAQIELLDSLVGNFAAADIPILGLLCGNTPGDFSSLFYPQLKYRSVVNRLNSFRKFVRFCVKRYGNIVSHWEIWNEPNLKRFWVKKLDFREYSEMLKKVSEDIRSIQSQSVIVCSGMSGNDMDNLLWSPNSLLNYKKYFSGIIENDYGKYFDVANFHPYYIQCYASVRRRQYFEKRSVAIIRELRSRVAELVPDKPMWLTEFGISTTLNLFLSQKDIAKIYIEVIKECVKMNVPLALWCLYDENNKGYGVTNPEKGFSLLDEDLVPNAIYDELLKFGSEALGERN